MTSCEEPCPELLNGLAPKPHEKNVFLCLSTVYPFSSFYIL